MDWRIVGTTFLTIFIAELGDKTQLGAFFMASSAPSKLSVFIGASLALVCSTAIAVVAGETVGRLVPTLWVQRLAGGLFILLGGAILWASRQ